MAVSESTELIDVSSDNSMIWNTHNKGLSLYCILNLSKYFPGHNMKIDVLCSPVFQWVVTKRLEGYLMSP